jgi:hypothetical protein
LTASSACASNSGGCSLRGHQPFVAIDRFAEFGDVASIFEFVGAHHVADQVGRNDPKRRIVAPFFRIADLGRELRELLESFRLGGRAHPVQVADALPIGDQQIADQRIHPGLALRGEILLDIDLAQVLADRLVYQLDATFPAQANLRCAVEHGPEEREVGVDILLGQVRSVVA